jgi:hypothetical protein
MSPISLELDRIRLTAEADDYSSVCCTDCHARLVIHQPDLEVPGRLLGTCLKCHAWFLIAAGAEVMLRLPDEETLHGV